MVEMRAVHRAELLSHSVNNATANGSGKCDKRLTRIVSLGGDIIGSHTGR